LEYSIHHLVLSINQPLGGGCGLNARAGEGDASEVMLESMARLTSLFFREEREREMNRKLVGVLLPISVSFSVRTLLAWPLLNIATAG
jgi:hypothetical protein